jgi:hypothetical protein
MEISLHKALSELKLLDKRIQDKMSVIKPTAIVQKNKKN